MATTYTPIATTTLGSAQASVTFSSISGSYTDLVLITNILGATGGTTDYTPNIRFNGDTGTNYSDTILRGNGSTATSGRHSTVTQIQLQGNGYLSNTTPCTLLINIQNYSNTTTYKTTLSRASQTDNITNATVGLWRNTAAITSLTIFLDAGTMASGTVFTLYGIKAA